MAAGPRRGVRESVTVSAFRATASSMKTQGAHMSTDPRAAIVAADTSLGIEFGSTRIKAVLIGGDHEVLATGGHAWENHLEGGLWSYTLDEVVAGLQSAYASLVADVRERYDVTPTSYGSIGISGMMHGSPRLRCARQAARALPHVAQHEYGPRRRRTDSPLRIQHSPALVDCPPAPGCHRRRGARRARRSPDDAGRLGAPSADGPPRPGHRRCFGYVPG